MTDRKDSPDGNDNKSHEETYVYKSAGIYEREGRVPLWLLLVIIGLLVWGVYYLIYYWHPP
jgi:hypothetical protein